MEKEKSMLRWGGLAGILAFVLWILEMPLYGIVDPFVPEGLMNFTDNRAALGLSTVVMMTIATMSIALILTLQRVLREDDFGLAMYGSVLGVTGYVATALGDASTYFAFAPISNLYQAPVVTTETQATTVLLWQANQGITNTFFFVGSLFMVICFFVLGLAMFGAPTFGRRFGAVSGFLGLIGVAAVITSLFVPNDVRMQVVGITVFSNLIFLPLFGWKCLRLSKGSDSIEEA